MVGGPTYDYEKATDPLCPGSYRTRVKRFLELQCFPSDLSHGTDAGYCYGCRCDRCRAAHAKKCREYREKNKKTHPYIDI